LSALAANAITRRVVRRPLLDLDWQSGERVKLEFDGGSGAARDNRLTSHQHKD
jgi:hypothetical protein